MPIIGQGCRRDKLVIRSVTDVLRTHSRFVKCVGGSPYGLIPHKFTNLLWVRNTSVTDLVTNNIINSISYTQHILLMTVEVNRTQGHLTINRASFPVFWSFVQLTHLNQNLHLVSRESIIFFGIRAVYVYHILFNEIFMFFIVFLYKTI